MEPDRQLSTEQACKIRSPSDVVEVAVSVENRRRSQTGSADAVDYPLGLLAGIDNDKLSRIAIADQHAVCLDRTHRENVEEDRCCHHSHRPTFSRVLNFES